MAQIVEPPQIGDVLMVELPEQRPPGQEQFGFRPAVVVGLPERLGRPRFPVLVVVPFTTQIGSWARQAPDLYPFFPAAIGGLRYDSVALLDHLRAIDAGCVVRRLGRLSPDQYTPLRHGLSSMFEFER